MEEQDKTKEENKIDEAFAGIPDEVIDFMNSNAFTIITNAIKQGLSLSDEQSALFTTITYELLLNTTTMEDGLNRLINKGVPAETALKILYLIDQEILTRAENITEFFTDDTEMTKEEMDAIIKEVPSTSSVALSSLSDRLKQASIATPAKRDYSLNKDTAVPAEAKPTIDPYHEPVDNE